MPRARLAALAIIGWAVPALAQDMPAPPGPYLVFFGWNADELNADARATLDNAAAAYQQVRGSSVAVIGHSDRSGSRLASRYASQRRADAVRDYLALRGVPIKDIATTAAGEERPLVPTADGVREAQNRRVEIRFEAPRAR